MCGLETNPTSTLPAINMPVLLAKALMNAPMICSDRQPPPEVM